MRAFEVYLNGEKQCLAGIGDEGALTVIISAVNQAPTNLTVSASIGPKGDFAKWVDQEINIGDQITVKLVATDVANQPTSNRKSLGQCRALNQPAQRAADISPGREPGVGHRKRPSARLTRERM